MKAETKDELIGAALMFVWVAVTTAVPIFLLSIAGWALANAFFWWLGVPS